jgi:hypothetical protein
MPVDLHVTDLKSLEMNGFSSDMFDVKDDHEETLAIKNVANRFVATLLEFNPDATEQLDLRSKHIANVENLGDQTRKKTS